MKKKVFFTILSSFLLLWICAFTCTAQDQVIAHNNTCTVYADSSSSSGIGNLQYIPFYVPGNGILKISFSAKFGRETNPVIQQNLGYEILTVDTEEYDPIDIYQLDQYWLDSLDYSETGNEMGDSLYNKEIGYTYSYEGYTNTLTPGYYLIRFFNGTGFIWNLSYTITWYPGFAEDLVLPSSITLKAGTSQTLTMTPSPSGTVIGIDKIIAPSSISTEVTRNQLKISPSATGTYRVNIQLKSGKTVSLGVNVTKASSPKLKYSTYKLYTKGTFTNQLQYTSKKVTWSSSNKKIATVNSKGKITAKAVGTCKIYAKSGGKTYTCTVKVIRQKPDFFAHVLAYSQSGNYFTVQIKNNTNKPLTIYSAKAQALYYDYPTYDRTLYLRGNKNLQIKANKEATFKFYVKGARTYSDYNKFSIHYKIKFDGKTYTCNTGSLWSLYVNTEKPTYTNGDQYYQWAV